MGWFSNSKFAFCRGIANHAWRYPPDLSYEGKQLAVTIHCANCGTSRKDRIREASGAVDGRSYEYPEGYLLDLKGDPRPEKALLRKDGLALLLLEAKRGTVHKLEPRRRHRGRAA